MARWKFWLVSIPEVLKILQIKSVPDRKGGGAVSACSSGATRSLVVGERLTKSVFNIQGCMYQIQMNKCMV